MKLLWVGDAACPSGFGRATHEILEVVRHTFDVTVLGINYRGDPHNEPYPIYCAYAGGDFNGIERLAWMCDLIKPDIIVVQNDPWNIPGYTRTLAQFKQHAHIPIVAAVAVDGKNCLGNGLNDLTLAVFWTQFGLDEARAGGFAGDGIVIPLGVDIEGFHPIDRYEARLRRGLPKQYDDVFIVGNVNRNQPRKRWDLTIKYFANWIKDARIEDAYLYMHTAPTGDTGVKVRQLAQYYGIFNRLMLIEPPVFYGIPENEMLDTYNCFDIQITTTQGEGFGLTQFEGMACGVPQIAPDWSALGELLKGAAWLVPCTSTAIGAPYVNVLGGVPDEALFIQAMNRLYHDKDVRANNGQAALERARQPRFRWANIGKQWTEALLRVAEEAGVTDREGVA